jgi:hypothetical protein
VINNTTKIVEVKKSESTYQAGVCNIGHAERERRKTIGLMGAILAVGWPFLCYVFVLPVLLKLLTFFPTFFGILGIWQYRKQYCAFYGLTGKYNLGDLGQDSVVSDKKQIEKDKEKSLEMIVFSLFVSVLYTLLIILFL